MATLWPLALAAGCGGAAAASGSGTCPIATALDAPTFSADILPALQASCGSATATCHGTAAPAGHVEYSTGGGRSALDVWADLVGVPPSNAPPGQGWLRIAPGDVARSWLVEKVTSDEPGGSGYGARMPYGGADVCAATVATIAAWINRGAPSD